MPSLRSKIDLSEVFGDTVFTLEDVEEIMRKTGITLNVEDAVKAFGCRIYRRHGDDLVIPAVFDVLLSGYRGSAENDHQWANYLTHALTTAIVNYANKGGEASHLGEISPYGDNAFHEFDLGMLMVEGIDRRLPDTQGQASLAFHYGDQNLPDYARKRTVILKNDTIAGHIQRLTSWQFEERRAKQNMHLILGWLKRGEISRKGLAGAVALLREQLDILGRAGSIRNTYMPCTARWTTDISTISFCAISPAKTTATFSRRCRAKK